MHPVAVVGGGITGLVAAYRLHRAGVDAVVVEGSDRLGGKILTADFAGTRVELGHDSFLSREPTLLDLCKELGLSADLIKPTGFGAQVWLEGGLRKLPSSTYFGIPLDVADARRSGLLTWSAASRARLGTMVPSLPHRNDLSVGAMVKRRYGRQVLDRMVDPILAGTRAGDPFEVSTQAALPEAWAALEKGERVAKALRGHDTATQGIGPPFHSLRGGMQSLVDALVAAMPSVTVRTNSQVSALRTRLDGYLLETSSGSVDASAVILATPARATTLILASLSPDAAEAAGELDAADVAIATFAFDGSLEVPEGTGLLVPRSRRRTLTGATWYSSKWPHAGVAGATIIRCFAGRARTDRLPADDDELLGTLHADLSDALGGLPEPTERLAVRWPGGLPIYRVGHLDRVDRIERTLEEHPRIRVAGASYRGSGLPDCAQQGIAAAEAVAANLGAGAR